MGFLIKMFKKVIYLSLFIHNISSKNDHDTTDREIFRNIQTGPALLAE